MSLLSSPRHLSNYDPSNGDITPTREISMHQLECRLFPITYVNLLVSLVDLIKILAFIVNSNGR